MLFLSKYLIQPILMIIATFLSAQVLANTEVVPESGSKGKEPNEEKILYYHPSQPNRTLMVRPAIPGNLNPQVAANVSGPSTEIKWGAVEESDAYSVQVSEDPGFFNLKVNEVMYSKTSLIVAELETGKTYFWRVAAIKSTNLPGYIKSNYQRSSFSVK